MVRSRSFEKVLSKLRGLAVKVVDETAPGDDVMDQYVDLQSQLTNLEATPARIQEFPALTLVPTATLITWNPEETFDEAKSTITVVCQGTGNFFILLAVVILPILLPPAIIIWAVWKLLNRKTGKGVSEKADGD